MKTGRKKHEEHENHERWLVSYADFITLLFAFFVVLYSTSSKNEEKEKSFEESVRAEMKLAVVSRGQGGQSGGDSIFGDLMNPLDQFPKRGGPAEIHDYLERQLRRRLTAEERKKYGIEVRHDGTGARISFSTGSLFAPGSVKLKKTSMEALHIIGGILAEADKKVMVEGHTDADELTSSDLPSHWELGSLRATTVVRYLIQAQKMEASRLAAVSYGDQMPLVPNTTEANKSRNRRIDLLIQD